MCPLCLPPRLVLGPAGRKVKTRTEEIGEENGGQVQGFPERLHPCWRLEVKSRAGSTGGGWGEAPGLLRHSRVGGGIVAAAMGGC